MNSAKFLVVGDIHIGVRSASVVVAEYQLKFFEQQLFPYMEAHKLDTILQLGDLFDTRKFSNHVILDMWKKRFFDVIKTKGYKMIVLVGNHDLPFNNLASVNSPRLFLDSYSDCVEIIDHPQHKIIKGCDFLIVPWICEENAAAVKDLIEDSEALYVAGHFEFAGFEMQKGIAVDHGDSVDLYEKFDLVMSGHYHTRSQKGNVLYTGVPYEMTWADFGDQKGFHVFDTKSHKIKFVKTTSSLFHRFDYDDSKTIPVAPTNLQGTYVKVVVLNKADPYQFEKFITNISAQDVIDLKITDIVVDIDDVHVGKLELEDTKTLISTFVKQVDTELDKERIKTLLHGLYLDALDVTE